MNSSVKRLTLEIFRRVYIIYEFSSIKSKKINDRKFQFFKHSEKFYGNMRKEPCSLKENTQNDLTFQKMKRQTTFLKILF